MQRWLKFAKLLPKEGWEPVVVTPSNPDVPVIDPTLAEDVSGELEVWSFPAREPTRVLAKLKLGKSTSRLGAEREASPSIASRLVRWVRGNVFLPDARVWWVKPTTRMVLKKMRESNIDLIVTTGPPHSMHLIGLALKRATGLPWVADFRDPWSTMDYLDDFHLTARSKRRLKHMEQSVVGHADRILVTSPGALRELGVRDAERGIVIPNGWDRDDFPTVTTTPTSSTPSIGHFGALYESRNPRALWKSLKELGWTLRLAGQVTPSVQSDLLASGVHVEHLGELSHRKAIEEMLRCDALLVTHNQSASARSSTPGKVFECLATRKPLLVVGPREGDLEKLCLQWGVKFVGHSDHDAEVQMLQWLENHASSVEEVRQNVNELSFERHVLTTELARMLNSLVALKK